MRKRKPLCWSIVRSLADFQEEWNEEHKPENREQ